MLGGSAIDALRIDAEAFYLQNPIPTDSPSSAVACDVCQMIDLARRKNLRIAFIGDSTQNQISGGLECELQRRGFVVEQESKDVNQDFDGTWANRRILRTRAMTIRSPLWEPGTFVTIHYHQLYMLPVIESSQMYDMTAQTDILVLGFGLHWWYTNDTPHAFRRADSYRTAMQDLLQKVALQGHVQLLVQRETTAEHYDSPGGDWSNW